MKAIMIMFDTLNRRYLQPYGCDKTITPNFLRLAQRSVTFHTAYAGGLPCMPARREIHTGRYGFLTRHWGPIEPYDDSMPEILKESGCYSHLVSDHDHYWEDGGSTYHSRYSSWENFRGQEGDPWKGIVGDVPFTKQPMTQLKNEFRLRRYRQHMVNYRYMTRQQDYSQVKTFDAGIDFIQTNYEEDNWFLQIESFDPHEPFVAPKEFQDLYHIGEMDKNYTWPDYVAVQEDEEQIEKVRLSYSALLTMCDQQLGRILDKMDELDLWKDTMLIVNTDHGYLLGEHGYWAKNYMPCYQEIAHIPLFIWDPRFPESAGTTRSSLVQTIDLAPTILNFFGIPIPKDMMGKPLDSVIAQDDPVREAGIFGHFGSHICCTDGRYVYMRAPQNIQLPLYEYTLMPTRMNGFFNSDELGQMTIAEPFSHTKNMRQMRCPVSSEMRCCVKQDLLFDLQEDPQQEHPIEDKEVTERMKNEIRCLMKQMEVPDEVYKRFDL